MSAGVFASVFAAFVFASLAWRLWLGVRQFRKTERSFADLI